MKRYTVKQLARLSGVSVRALHHYDDIGLLKPAYVGANRYRYYGRDELLRLQDILFHRELGVPLHDIALLLQADGRDRLAILREHRERLAERVREPAHQWPWSCPWWSRRTASRSDSPRRTEIVPKSRISCPRPGTRCASTLARK